MNYPYQEASDSALFCAAEYGRGAKCAEELSYRMEDYRPDLSGPMMDLCHTLMKEADDMAEFWSDEVRFDEEQSDEVLARFLAYLVKDFRVDLTPAQKIAIDTIFER